MTLNDELEHLFRTAPVGMAVLDSDLRLQRINAWLSATTGEPVEAHIGRTLKEVLPESASQLIPLLQKVIDTKEPVVGLEIEVSGSTEHGVHYWLVSSNLTEDSEGKVQQVFLVLQDITDRKQAKEALQTSYAELEQRVEERTAELTESNATLRQEIFQRSEVDEALRKSEARLAGIIEIAADAIISIDSAQQIVLFNRAAETIFGYLADEVIGQSLDILMPPRLHADHREHVMSVTRSAESSRQMAIRSVTVMGRRKNGEEFPAEAAISKIESGSQIINSAVLRDVSERKQAEEELQQHRRELAHVLRTATMGELTAALAHEINQPLAAILSNAQAGRRIMNTDTPDLDEISEILDEIINDDQRAAEVIRHMRGLLSGRGPDTQTLDINDIARDVIHLVRSDSVIRGVVVDLELSEGLSPVQGDPIQLQQVCLNLILNGFDAMQEVSIPERRLVIQTAVEGDNDVCMSIQDTGVGFGEQNADDLFVPFQTTKVDGLGMGLAISRSIIEAHGGKILGRANPDGGAVFQFTLPGVC